MNVVGVSFEAMIFGGIAETIEIKKRIKESICAPYVGNNLIIPVKGYDTSVFHTWIFGITPVIIAEKSFIHHNN